MSVAGGGSAGREVDKERPPTMGSRANARPTSHAWRQFVATAAAFVATLAPSLAYAHGAEGGIVLLLPTGYYLAGAVVAVAASFVLLAVLPAGLTERLAAMRLRFGTVPNVPRVPISLFSFLLLCVFVAAGYLGTRDPVANPLPPLFWSVWWIDFTLLQAVIGPLWAHLNPWTGILALLGRHRREPLARLPAGLGYHIAVLQFATFAWFELIDLAPSDPDRLATAIIVYFLFNLLGAMVFGEKDWMERAEPFSIFFGLIGRLSIFHRQAADGNRTAINLVWPGASLIGHAALPLSGVIFVLMTLAAGSFDGLSRTFVWLDTVGVNPLEFPGRSAVMTSGTLGFVAAVVALSSAFLLSVRIGAHLAGEPSKWVHAAGRLVYSIVPIALAFQFSHYLTGLIVDGQNAVIAISDPFDLGGNLFGTGDWRTTTSFLNTLSGVTMIFDAQTLAIALGHIVGIVMAHVIATDIFGNARKAVLSQVPLAALMVFYTGFGLWLLSTPRI